MLVSLSLWTRAKSFQLSRFPTNSACMRLARSISIISRPAHIHRCIDISRIKFRGTFYRSDRFNKRVELYHQSSFAGSRGRDRSWSVLFSGYLSASGRDKDCARSTCDNVRRKICENKSTRPHCPPPRVTRADISDFFVVLFFFLLSSFFTYRYKKILHSARRRYWLLNAFEWILHERVALENTASVMCVRMRVAVNMCIYIRSLTHACAQTRARTLAGSAAGVK